MPNSRDEVTPTDGAMESPAPPGSATHEGAPSSADPTAADGSSRAEAIGAAPVSADPSDLPLGEDLRAVEEEGLVVDEAADRPASGGDGRRRRSGERAFLLGTLVLGVLLFVGWIAGTAIWQLRKDVATLTERLAGVEQSADRSARAQARATVLRAGADLEALEVSVPADVSGDLGEARAMLQKIADRLTAQ